MDEREQRRVIVLTQVMSRTITMAVAEAAVQMQVSERQVQRLLAGFRREGGGGRLSQRLRSLIGPKVSGGVGRSIYAISLFASVYAGVPHIRPYP